MESNDKYQTEPPPPYSLTFHDPFASVAGGIGSLRISMEVNRPHATSNATSTTSVQCSTSDPDIESTGISRRCSAPSPTTPISRDSSPPKAPGAEDTAGDNIAPSMFLPQRDNDLIFPSPDFGPLDSLESVQDPESPASSGSSKSFDPDITPRPTSRNDDSEHNGSLDGGADISRSHGKTRRPSPVPFSSSPALMTRSISVAGSSIRSFRSIDVPGDEWNIETLRDMTDVVREAVRSGSIPNGEREILSEILTVLLIDEQEMNEPVEFNVLALTYFDKLLDAIMSHPFKDIGVEIHARATSLQHRWQQRFKEKYFSIDDYRINDMRQCALWDLTLDLADWKTDQPWHVTNNEPISHKEGDLGFEPGSWWLNLACAFRDGIVGGVEERATKGPYIVTALPLLSGEEVEGPAPNQYEYVKRGTVKEMLFGLLGNRGGPIRILRGHTLKSKFAPEIGVRYEGLHIVKQYGHKLVDENNNVYQCRLVLERLSGQRSINEVLQYPTPSQKDDWALYNRIVGEYIRSHQGEVAYSDWREFQDAQSIEKEDYIREKALAASFPRYKLAARKRITSKDSRAGPRDE